jgi:hypothetical protein
MLMIFVVGSEIAYIFEDKLDYDICCKCNVYDLLMFLDSKYEDLINNAVYEEIC